MRMEIEHKTLHRGSGKREVSVSNRELWGVGKKRPGGGGRGEEEEVGEPLQHAFLETPTLTRNERRSHDSAAFAIFLEQLTFSFLRRPRRNG